MPVQLVHCLWALQQLNALPDTLLTRALGHAEAIVRTHALRIMHESPTRTESRYGLIVDALTDKNAHVQRAAIEALTDYPAVETVKRVLTFLETIPAFDTHLTHTAQLALQTLLRHDTLSKTVAAGVWSPTEQTRLLLPMSGVDAAHAAQFLLSASPSVRLDSTLRNEKTELRLLLHIGRYLPQAGQPTLVNTILANYPGNIDTQMALLKAIRQGIQQQGIEPHELVKKWASSLATTLVQLPLPTWHSEVEGTRPLPTTLLEVKQQADKCASVGFRTYQSRGSIHSSASEAPATFACTIWTGALPLAENQKPFFIRLVTGDESRKVLAQEEIPVVLGTKVIPIRWDLASYAGEGVFLDVLDQSDATIYVGNFEGVPPSFLPVDSPDKVEERKLFSSELSGELGITSAETTLTQTLQTPSATYGLRVAAAEALLKINPHQYAPVLGQFIENERNSASLRLAFAKLLGSSPIAETQRVMETALKRATGDVQLELLKSLAITPFGKDLILNQVQEGALYARALL